MTEPMPDPTNPDEEQPPEPLEEPQPDAEPTEEEQAEEEEPTPAEGEPEPQEEQPQAMSEREIEKVNDQLDRETARHLTRVYEVFGGNVEELSRLPKGELRLRTVQTHLSEMGFAPCVMCEPNMPGIVVPQAMTAERLNTIRLAIGDRQPRELRPDPHSQECPECGGEGEVQTPSHVQGKDVAVCMTCNGNGAIGERFDKPGTFVPQPAAPTFTNGPLAGE